MKPIVAGVVLLLICLAPPRLTARALAQDAGAAYREEWVRLTQGYLIGVEFDRIEFHPAYYRLNPRWTVVPKDKRLAALKALELDLARYDPAFLRRNISRIYLYESLSFACRPYGGTADEENRALYIQDGNLGEHNLPGWGSGFHHEFSSILWRRNREKFPEKAWRAVNPPGFQYRFDIAGPANLDGDVSGVEEPSCFLDGFLCTYGKVTLEDDLNTYAEYFVGTPERLVKIASEYPAVKKKYDLLAAFYKAIGYKPQPRPTPPPSSPVQVASRGSAPKATGANVAGCLPPPRRHGR